MPRARGHSTGSGGGKQTGVRAGRSAGRGVPWTRHTGHPPRDADSPRREGVEALEGDRDPAHPLATLPEPISSCPTFSASDPLPWGMLPTSFQGTRQSPGRVGTPRSTGHHTGSPAGSGLERVGDRRGPLPSRCALWGAEEGAAPLPRPPRGHQSKASQWERSSRGRGFSPQRPAQDKQLRSRSGRKTRDPSH